MIMLIVAVLGGFIKGFAGFGSSLFIGSALLLFYDPLYVIPLMVLISVFLNVLLFIEHVHHIKDLNGNFAFRKETLGFMFIGIILGAYLLRFLDPSYIKMAFGLIILVVLFEARKHLHKHKHEHPGIVKNSLVGFFGGLFSGMINVNGPFAAMYGLHLKYNKIKLMKATIIFSFIADIVTLVVFYFNGFFISKYTVFYIIGMLVALIGFIIGMEVRRKTDHTKFKEWVWLLLIIFALKLIIDGFYVMII